MSLLTFISRTISANTSLTLVRFLALASTNGQPQNWARVLPSIVGTSRWCSRSILLATSKIGTRSDPLTLVMSSFMGFMSWNVWWLVKLYTTTKPCPFFIYKSRMLANCSVPAVSNISSTHGELSTSISFL